MISRKFQKGLSTAFMEEAVKKLLVTIKQGIKLMWKSKNDMEVRGIDNFGPAFIYPDFLINSLTVRAVTVLAEITMNLYMAAVRTLRAVEAELTGFTV